MATNRRKFKRPLREQRYRKLFLIAAEGDKTEPQYFRMLNNIHITIRVNCLKGHSKSSPLQVLKRMKDYLVDAGLKKSDEAWLVVDKDQWNDEQLNQLFQWSKLKENYGFALSNPKFEYWILLHFEDGTGVSTSRECTDQLKKYLPDYDKEIPISKLKNCVQLAIGRAKKKDSPPCDTWPQTTGTTVYRLVEKIMAAEKET